MSQLIHSNPLFQEGLKTSLATPEQERFWRDRLRGLHRSATLRHDGSNPHTNFGNAIDRREIGLGTAKINEFAQTHDLEPETIIIAAWAVLLMTYNSEHEAFFALRFPTADLASDQLWPITVSRPDNITVLPWLKQLNQTVSELRAQKPVSLVDLHLWFEVPASETLIESVVDFSTHAQTTYPVTVRPMWASNILRLTFLQHTMLLERRERLGAQFACAIEGLITSPDSCVSDIDVLPVEERAQVLVDWNDTERRYSRIDNLQQFFELQATKTPDGIAVELPGVNGTDSKTLTYRELNSRSNQIAHRLRKLGVGPDSIVGICAERSLELAVGVLGIVKSGAAYVPFDPNYPKDRLEFMLEDTKAPVILTQSHLRNRLPPDKAKILCLDTEWADIAREISLNPPSETQPNHLAYLIYTSGSTGKPKGVAMRQEPLVNLLHWQLENFSFNAAARTLQFASINFDVSFQELFSTWCSGGTLVLISEEQRRDSSALIHFLQQNRVERIFLPFVALKHLAEAAERENIYPERLREVITAGEQLQITPQLTKFFKRLPKCTLENQYGPSEAHVVTAFRLQGPPDNWPPLPSIGKPIANTQMYILNGKLRPVPIGIAGELFIGGFCLARGYLNRPELTAEKFIRNPFSKDPESRLYKTGDLARYLPDGNIEFLGRIDHQVKIRGFRIELGEIEALLSKHPGVKEAVAMAVANVTGEKQLVAYIVPSSNDLTSSALRDYLKALVPSYAVPGAFVFLEKLPISPNGKVDRKALPAPSDEHAIEEDSSPVKMPRDALEMQIKLVFEKFLKRRNIGVDVSFFEIGGDSLQALKLVLEVERVTGKKLPLSVLFEAATVEALAAKIRAQSGEETFSSLVPLQPLGSKPPLYLIHTTPGDVLGYGNLIYHLPDQPCYGLQSLGLDRQEKAHTSVPEMASYYVKLIREKQPHGPYYLGGWCYGGIIAVEMAHQFLAMGEPVGPLMLIETPAPPPFLVYFLYYFRRIFCALRMGPVGWFKYIKAKINYYRNAKSDHEKRFRRAEAEGDEHAEQVEEQNKTVAKLEYLYNTNLAALDKYKSRFYPGKIVLFNATERDPAVIYDPLYGWPGLAREITSYEIPGNHDTILMEPNVRLLAQKISESLHGNGASDHSPQK